MKKRNLSSPMAPRSIARAYEQSVGRLFRRYRKRQRGVAVRARMEFIPDMKTLETYLELRANGHSHEEALQILKTKELPLTATR